MARITFIQPDGSASTVEVPNGLTVMEGAIEHDITGVIAQCGGSCSCSTCQIRVTDELDGLVLHVPAEQL